MLLCYLGSDSSAFEGTRSVPGHAKVCMTINSSDVGRVIGNVILPTYVRGSSIGNHVQVEEAPKYERLRAKVVPQSRYV